MGADRLTWFNDLPAEDAQRALVACCAAPGWAAQMAAARPYGAAHDAIRQSSTIVAQLTVPDLAAALAGHPRIGERMKTNPNNVKPGPIAADWSRREQAGVDTDDARTRQALAEANVEYERRFGHIYLVCASGRTGGELLQLLRGRLLNRPDEEWQVVRAELQKINALRLERFLAGSS